MKKDGYAWHIINWINKRYPTWARYQNRDRIEWVWYFEDNTFLKLDLYEDKRFYWNYVQAPWTQIPDENEWDKKFSEVKKYLKNFHGKNYILDYTGDEVPRMKVMGRFGYVTKD